MQVKLAKEILHRFYYEKRFKLYFVVFMSLVASLFEYMGLILIFQFIMMLSNPNSNQALIIASFLKNNFNITDFSYICLILGVSVALIYIFKDIYLYFYTKISTVIFQDLSINMAVKLLKNILFADFTKVNSIPNDIKLGFISKVDIAVWKYLIQYINLITNVAIIVILMTFLFVKFTIPACISVIFISILSYIEYRILKEKSNYLNQNFNSYFDALNKLIYLIVNASKEIRLNNKSGYFLSKAKDKYQDVALLNKKFASDSVFHIYFTEILIMVTFIIVFLTLFFTTKFNNQTIIVTIGAIIAVILRMTPAVNRMQSSMYAINSNENIANEIVEFDRQFENVTETVETKETIPFKDKIILKDISYIYPNKPNGLKDINLVIKKGEFIGIVGKSGCYKTTLSLIIAGLIAPQKGKMTIDDIDIDCNNINMWRNNISILSQDFSILKDNIFDNLDDEIIEKLKLEGLNSNPLMLSFGQKQRAALAQIVAQNKNLLILDEATSSLDVLSEDKINDMLFELKGKKTIISIAHRLQILKHCDRIIYMDNAKIIDIDTFINLNDKYSEFKKIVELSNFKL